MSRFKLPLPPAKLRDECERFCCGKSIPFATEAEAQCFVAYLLGRCSHNTPLTLRDLEITPPGEAPFWKVGKR